MDNTQDSQPQTIPPFAASNGSETVAWSKESPDKAGWWWLNRNGDSCVVKVVPQRAFGNRLCAFVPTIREWLPVEEITHDVIPCQWGGPIPLPSESPNDKLTHPAGREGGA